MNDWRVVLMLLLPGILGMRDPFQPPEDKCSTSQLERWHYRGWITHGDFPIALVEDPLGQWRRMKQGEWIGAKWRVTKIETEQIALSLGAECEPSQWRWRKEGTENVAKDISAVNAADERR